MPANALEELILNPTLQLSIVTFRIYLTLCMNTTFPVKHNSDKLRPIMFLRMFVKTKNLGYIRLTKRQVVVLVLFARKIATMQKY